MSPNIVKVQTLVGHTFEHDVTASSFGVLSDLFNCAKSNMIRFNYKGCALAPMDAAGRIASGETVSPNALGHVSHGKNQMAFLNVGTKKDNLNVLLCRAMSSRKIKLDNSYDYRSYVMASPIMGVNVPEIEVQKNFEGWKTYSLDNMPIFPQLHDVNDIEMLLFGLILRAQIEHDKAIIDNEKKRLMTQFKKMVSAGENKLIGDDGIVYYVPASGTTMSLVDSEGNHVGGVPSEATNGVKLVPQVAFTNNPLQESGKETIIQTKGKNAGSPIFAKLNDLPWLFAESKRLGEELKSITANIRPFELGVAETNINDQYAALAGHLINVERFSIKSYDLPPETADKLDSGEWKMAEVPKTQGRNIYNPDPDFDPSGVDSAVNNNEDDE